MLFDHAAVMIAAPRARDPGAIGDREFRRRFIGGGFDEWEYKGCECESEDAGAEALEQFV